MKTTITSDDQGYITISYDCAYTGERITRTFFCPINGGYVRESLHDYPQVCEQLAHHGSTLTCSSRGHLIDVIRREYRAMRRAEKREEQLMRGY
jgi:hypothetical protein